ncbi:hypothetical protein [Acetoanaerobium noterae]|jgi:hypothetical protein|uniref:hypothetical protein n=1 Tax=Acetoanaerobium noterae TaxID=745369 RepID=UPI0028B00D48|nr:hypothetical protein [Acetoanaerobium noterae]
MIVSYLIGAVIVFLGIFLLVRSVKREATDGCYACSSKGSCSKAGCNVIRDIKTDEKK